jgi:integral membrane protein
MQDPLPWLRRTSLAEGVSYLLLLGIAMPLKYLAGYPLAVRVVGWIHGLLFIGFCYSLFEAAVARGWPWTKSLKFFVAALLPLGPFVIDRGLRDELARGS